MKISMYYVVFLLTVALKKVQLSIAYPIVCGAGVALIAGIGAVYFKETFSPLKVIGTLAIVGGVIALNIAGTSRCARCGRSSISVSAPFNNSNPDCCRTIVGSASRLSIGDCSGISDRIPLDH